MTNKLSRTATHHLSDHTRFGKTLITTLMSGAFVLTQSLYATANPETRLSACPVVKAGFQLPKGEHDGFDYIVTNISEKERELAKEIRAAAPGIVIVARRDPWIYQGIQDSGGNVVLLYHGEHPITGKHVYSLYAHNKDIVVREGDVVQRNQKLATLSDTGNWPKLDRAGGRRWEHLHFGVWEVNTGYFFLGGGPPKTAQRSVVHPNKYGYNPAGTANLDAHSGKIPSFQPGYDYKDNFERAKPIFKGFTLPFLACGKPDQMYKVVQN